MKSAIARIIELIRRVLGYTAPPSEIIKPREIVGHKCTIFIHQDPEYRKAIVVSLKTYSSDLLQYHTCKELAGWIEVQFDYSPKNRGWLFISCWQLSYSKAKIEAAKISRDEAVRARNHDHAAIVYRGGFFPKSKKVGVRKTPVFVQTFTANDWGDSSRYANGAVIKVAELLKERTYDRIPWASALKGNATYRPPPR